SKAQLKGSSLPKPAMKTENASRNWLELSITVFVPTLVLAAYIMHKGGSLGELKSLIAATLIGLFGAIAHYAVLTAMRRSAWRDEVLLQTGLRLAVSALVAVLVGRLFFG